MMTAGRIGMALFGGALALVASRGLAFEVTLDAGTGSLTIVDNDGNDLNPAPDFIDFSTTVGGVFAADGRVTQFVGPIARGVEIGTRTAGGEGIFRNLDSAAHTFTVTVEGDPFAPPGPALGWALFFTALADDTTTPTPGDVEIPVDAVSLRIDPGDALLSTVSAPVTPPVGPGEQPVVLNDDVRAVDPAGDATRVRVLWSFTPGPFDELRLPDEGGFADGAILASVFNAEDKCVFRMNKDAAQVAKAGATDDATCLKVVSKMGGGNATACVDDRTTLKMAAAEDRLLTNFPIFCSVPPAFATNVLSCCEGGASDGAPCLDDGGCLGGACTAGACISGAAETASSAIAHDLFGATVTVADHATAASKCQQKVAKAVAKVHNMRWKALVACKRYNISSFATEADFVSTCLGPPQPDPSLIAKSQAGLAAVVQKSCLDKGVTGLATVLPGACASESDAGYADCLGRRVACRFCGEVVAADDVIAPLDCDVSDDGTANGSCP